MSTTTLGSGVESGDCMSVICLSLICGHASLGPALQR